MNFNLWINIKHIIFVIYSKKFLHHLYFIHIPPAPQILQTAKKIIIVFIDKT